MEREETNIDFIVPTEPIELFSKERRVQVERGFTNQLLPERLLLL